MNVCLNQVLCLIIPFLLLLRLDYSYLVLSVSLSLNVLLCFRSSFCITIDILHFIFFLFFVSSFFFVQRVLVRQK